MPGSKNESNTNRFAPSIRAVSAFFAVLLGFGLKNLLSEDDPLFETYKWYCFSLSVLLFLRYILGTTNHLWNTYIKLESRELTHAGFIKDLTFILLFGFLGMRMCYSTNVGQFLERSLWLLGIALLWMVRNLYYYLKDHERHEEKVIDHFNDRKSIEKNNKPDGSKTKARPKWLFGSIIASNFKEYGNKWSFWWWINSLQLLSTAIVWYLFDDHLRDLNILIINWNASLTALIGIYIWLLYKDFSKQLNVLKYH